MTKNSGQVAVEFVVVLPALILGLSLLGFQISQLLLEHFLWADLITLHRARLYNPDTPCAPHSFWPPAFRSKIIAKCDGRFTRLSLDYSMWKEKLQISAEYYQ
jgi:hypothetical protein